jgi:hypothetical protein
MKSKIIVVFIIASTCLSCIKNQKIENIKRTDRQVLNVQGNVKSIIEKNSTFPTQPIAYMFDKKGVLIKKVEIDEKLQTKEVVYKYNWNYSTLQVYINGKKGLQFKFDKYGNEVLHIGDNFRERTINEYDENHNLIKASQYNSKGKLWKETSYKYDDNGNMIESVSYQKVYNDIDGELKFNEKFLFLYSNEGLLSEQINCETIDCKRRSRYEFDAFGNPTMGRKYVYDSKNNWIKMSYMSMIYEREIKYY